MPDPRICLETWTNNVKIEGVVADLYDQHLVSDVVGELSDIKLSIASLNRIHAMNLDASGFRSMADLKAWLTEQGLIPNETVQP